MIFTVPAESDGVRLDHFLVSVWAEQSRSQIQRLIKDGRVEVEGRPAKPNRPLKSGQQRQRRRSRADRSDVRRPRRSRCRSSTRTATSSSSTSRPAWSCIRRPATPSGTLVNALLHHVDDLSGIGGEKRPGIVHRLDRGTSGLMVVAKHDAAHEELARQFHDREVEKEYIALVWGTVVAGRRIDAPIGRDPGNRKKMSARARRSREAVTRIVRAEAIGPLTLAQVAIHTGRTHQIRVHLSAIGHPVVGDPLYGGVHRRVPGDLRAVDASRAPVSSRRRLAFNHPVDQTTHGIHERAARRPAERARRASSRTPDLKRSTKVGPTIRLTRASP